MLSNVARIAKGRGCMVEGAVQVVAKRYVVLRTMVGYAANSRERMRGPENGGYSKHSLMHFKAELGFQRKLQPRTLKLCSHERLPWGASSTRRENDGMLGARWEWHSCDAPFFVRGNSFLQQNFVSFDMFYCRKLVIQCVRK